MRKLNVNTAMPRPQKSTPQAKRVTPPAVPSSDLHNRNSGVPGNFVSGTTNNTCNNIGVNTGSSNTGNHPRNNCPGYSSLEDGGFTQTRESPAALSIKDEISEYSTSAQQSTANNIVTVVNTNKSPNNINPYVTPTAFTFPISGREPLTHKAAVFYHQQLALQEDQGIDLTQSPGRDSPGSSSGSAGSGSRHSTASLDSGRASSYITSGGGSTASTRGALSSPRCSVSSCSIGSVDRMSQRSDNDIIIEWLSDMKFDEYAQLFTAAGYDLPTITRMTPEDLTAIGIKNPHHRERIKQHIDNLQLPDGLPNFVPGSIEEWLRLLRLEEYIQPLLDQNYKTVRDVTQVTWEDLEDIGIVKLGHQKKILLAIKRVKDIISGKWNLKGGNNQQHQQQSTPTSSSAQKEYNNVHNHNNNNNIFQNNNFYNNHHQNGGLNNNNNNINKLVFGSQQQHYEQQNSRISWDDSRSQEIYKEYSGVNHESNDIVLIKIRQPRGKSLESLEDISERNTRTHLTFSHYSTDYTYFPQHMQMHPVHQMQQQQQQQQQLSHLQHNPNINKHLCMNSTLPYHVGNLQWRRSYDDGDITPTNEIASDLNEGGGTLPRQRSGNPSARCRLLDNCSVIGTSLSGSTCSNSSGNSGINVVPQQSHLINSGDYKSCPSQQDNVIIMSNAVRYSAGCSPLPNKKTAPEPPRRQCSVRQTGRSSSVPEQSIILSQQHQQQQQQQQQNLIQQQQQYYIHQQQQQQNNSNNSNCRNSQQYIPSQHFQQQIQQQPIYVNYSTVHQTTAEIHCDKTHDSKSNSSIDSIDTIPFANENTGTIKQRLLNRQEISSSLSLSSSSSSSSSTNTVANIAQSLNSLKTSGSLHETTLHSIIGNNTGGGGGGGGSSNSSCCGGNTSADHTPPSPTVPSPPIQSASGQQIDSYHNLHQSYHEIGLNDDCCDETNTVACSIDGVIVPKCGNNNDGTIITNSINPNDSVNVLNDIGNMLANLTDELDAMLEEEKRVGISDSE